VSFANAPSELGSLGTRRDAKGREGTPPAHLEPLRKINRGAVLRGVVRLVTAHKISKDRGVRFPSCTNARSTGSQGCLPSLVGLRLRRVEDMAELLKQRIR